MALGKREEEILQKIAEIGEEIGEEEVCVLDLFLISDASRSALQSALKRLTNRGLLTRQKHRGHGNMLFYSLTNRGRMEFAEEFKALNAELPTQEEVDNFVSPLPKDESPNSEKESGHIPGIFGPMDEHTYDSTILIGEFPQMVHGMLASLESRGYFDQSFTSPGRQRDIFPRDLEALHEKLMELAVVAREAKHLLRRFQKGVGKARELEEA